MKQKILVIDCDTKYSELIEKTFPEQEIVVIEEPVAALKFISQEVPSVIVLAIELLNSSGFSLCRKIRKYTEVGEIPLIIVSSEATAKTFEQHKKLKDRANEYLLKPFDSEKIRQVVSTYLVDSREIRFRNLQGIIDSEENSSGFIPLLIRVVIVVVVGGYFLIKYL